MVTTIKQYRLPLSKILNRKGQHKYQNRLDLSRLNSTIFYKLTDPYKGRQGFDKNPAIVIHEQIQLPFLLKIQNQLRDLFLS